jgi:Disaggregatase related
MRALLLSVVLVGCVAVCGMGATLNVPSTYSTIQSAIDAAVNGDTVLVGPGTYGDHILIQSDSLSLIASEGPSQTKFGWSDYSTSPFQISNSNCIISGFAFENKVIPEQQIIMISNSKVRLSNNVFRRLNGSGALISAGGPGEITIDHNIFEHIIHSNALIVIVEPFAKIFNNTLDSVVRGIAIFSDTPKVENNIISNTTIYGLYFNNGNQSEKYNAFWSNGANLYSCCQDVTDLVVDPKFQDFSSGDYRLLSNSPCINAGYPHPAYDDPDGTRNDIGAIYYNLGSAPNGSIRDVPSVYSTIQSAINLAVSGDTVRVAPGVYSGVGNRRILLNGNTLVILGAGIDNTIVEMNGMNDTAFLIDSYSLTDTSVFRGFTIRNGIGGILGNSTVKIIDSVKFLGLSAFGANLFDGSASLAHCQFEGNGIALFWPSNFTITDCKFTQNSIALDFYYGGNGVGNRCLFENNIYVVKTGESKKSTSSEAASESSVMEWKSLDADSCEFIGNGTIFEGYYDMSATHSTFKNNNVIFVGGWAAHFNLKKCEIRGTTQTIIKGRNASHVVLDSCLIRSNPGDIFLDPLGPGYWDGSEVQIMNSTLDSNSGRFQVSFTEVDVINSLYRNNAYPLAFLQDGNYGSLEVNSCNVVNNYSDGIYFAPTGGYDIRNRNGIRNTLVSNNTGRGLNVAGYYSDSVHFECSNVYANAAGNYVGIPDQTGINGNISADPLFCDTANGDFRIAKQSPCAPLNNSCGVQIGAFGIGCALPEVTAIEVDNIASNMHLLAHVPSIDWNLQDTLAGVQTSFEIAVGTDNDWAFAEKWNPAPFNSPDTFVTYDGSALVDGQTYYLRLRVSNGTEWSAWHNTSFRMNSVPTIPAPLSPDSGVAASTTPTLWVTNATDAEGDALTYEFAGFHDTDCVAPPIAHTGVAQTPDSTGGVITTPLGENCRYWWQVRAFDGYEYSPWSANSMFAVNGTPEPPTAPDLASPPAPPDKPVFDLLPTFVWNPSYDPDPNDTVRYRLEISTTQNFTFVNTTDSLLTTSHKVADSLFFGTRYWWKVSAFDKTGLRTYSPTVKDFWTWKLGDVNHSHTTNIVDLTAMVAFLFTGGTAPDPKKIADFNGNCVVNIVDVTYFVDFLFRGGPDPRVGCAP